MSADAVAGAIHRAGNSAVNALAGSGQGKEKS
jgi:hypothetical protein